MLIDIKFNFYFFIKLKIKTSGFHNVYNEI